MDLVREEAEERVYEREAVLGRDARSVFPTEIAKQAADDRATAAESLGGRNFITESELEAIKAERGETQEQVLPDKPLAQVLADAKQAQEDAFQAQWKQMKTGKNRPLDEDELEFLDTLQQQAQHADAAWRAEQDREMDAYQQAVRARAEARSAGKDEAASPAQPGPQPQAQPAKQAQTAKQQLQKAAPRRPPLQVVRKKPSSTSGAAAGSKATPDGGPLAKRQHTGSAAAVSAPGELRQAAAAAAQAGGGNPGADGDGGSLAGLLGNYGSGDDSE